MIHPPSFYGLWTILSPPTLINRFPETSGVDRSNGVLSHANVYPDTSSSSLPSPLFVDIFPCCGTIDLRFCVPYQSSRLLHPYINFDLLFLPILENLIFFFLIYPSWTHCYSAICTYVHIIFIFGTANEDSIVDNMRTTISTPADRSLPYLPAIDDAWEKSMYRRGASRGPRALTIYLKRGKPTKKKKNIVYK